MVFKKFKKKRETVILIVFIILAIVVSAVVMVNNENKKEKDTGKINKINKTDETNENGKAVYLQGELINLSGFEYFQQYAYEIYRLENNSEIAVNTLPEFGCGIRECVNDTPVYGCVDPGPERCVNSAVIDSREWVKEEKRCGDVLYKAGTRKLMSAGAYRVRIQYFGNEKCEGKEKVIEKEFEVAECASDKDCVPAQCCHSSICTASANAPACGDIACSLECTPGTLDCGQGRCLCREGKCTASILK